MMAEHQYKVSNLKTSPNEHRSTVCQPQKARLLGHKAGGHSALQPCQTAAPASQAGSDWMPDTKPLGASGLQEYAHHTRQCLPRFHHKQGVVHTFAAGLVPW